MGASQVSVLRTYGGSVKEPQYGRTGQLAPPNEARLLASSRYTILRRFTGCTMKYCGHAGA